MSTMPTIQVVSITAGLVLFHFPCLCFSQLGGADVGREIREAQQQVTTSPTDSAIQQRPSGMEDLPAPSDDSGFSWRFWQSRDAAPQTPVHTLECGIRLSGDWQILWEHDMLNTLDQSLSERNAQTDLAIARDVAADFRQRLINKGYLLAALEVIRASDGVVEIVVDGGRYGSLRIYRQAYTEDGTPIREPYKGRFFGEGQIERMLSDFYYDSLFYYPAFYNRLYEINMHPDLTLNARLRLRRDEHRYADMEISVEEQLPLHAILGVNNTGTESTEDWRAGLTLQHLNLFQRQDVLTFRGINATDFSALNSFSLSYRLPYRSGLGGAVSLFGGYSRVDSEEIAPDIRIKGSGWFSGFQNSHRLIDSPLHVFSIGAGAVYRVMDDQLVFAETPGRTREAESLPVSVSFSYAAKQEDALKGRNYFTIELSYNAGAAMNISSDEAFNDLRQDATEAYGIQRIQVARLQSLYWGEGNRARRDWTLFLKSEGQYADGALIPAEQFSVGGMNTVRGYEERAILGDHGGLITAELRTPMFQNLLTRVWNSPQDTDSAGAVDRLQLLAFVDAGFISRAELLQGEERTESIYSAGTGIRWSLSRYAQFRGDIGYRFEPTLTQEKGVGFHVSMQLQY